MKMFARNAQMKVTEKQEISMSTTHWGLKSSNNQDLTNKCLDYSDVVFKMTSRPSTKVDCFSLNFSN